MRNVLPAKLHTVAESLYFIAVISVSMYISVQCTCESAFKSCFRGTSSKRPLCCGVLISDPLYRVARDYDK